MAEGKPVRESVSEYAELALPNDVNKLGNIFGGKVMHLVDLAGAMAAIRHARLPCVTASVDSLQFLHPVHSGELILLRSSVNRAFRTSMEVGVKVITENLMTGERLHTCSAYLTFVALDENGKPNIGPFPCGGVVTIHSGTREITRSGQYWAFTHYSRAFRRSANVIQSEGDIKDVHHVAAENPDGTYAAVLTNTGPAHRTVWVRQGKSAVEVPLPSDSVVTLAWS